MYIHARNTYLTWAVPGPRDRTRCLLRPTLSRSARIAAAVERNSISTTRNTPTAPACSAHAVNPAPSSTDQCAVCVLAASWMGGGDLSSCGATSPTRTRNQLLKLGHRTVTCDLKKTFCDTKSFLTFSLAHTRTPSFSYGTVLTQATIIFQRRPPVQKRPTYMQLKPF